MSGFHCHKFLSLQLKSIKVIELGFGERLIGFYDDRSCWMIWFHEKTYDKLKYKGKLKEQIIQYGKISFLKIYLIKAKLFMIATSTPDIVEVPITKVSHRQSRRKSRQAKTYFEFRMENPFLSNGNQNPLPPQLSQQLAQMQYITPQSINTLGMPRRSSNFAKKLMQMKSVARKQEEKYNGMVVDSQNRIQLGEEYESPLNIHEDDQLSLRIQYFYDQKEGMDDFDIFTGQNDEVMFYSNNELEMNECYERVGEEMQAEMGESNGMDEELNNYFT